MDYVISLLGPLSHGAVVTLKLFAITLVLSIPLGLVLAQKLVQTFHMVDLNQLYTILFCLWFLVLGAIEFFILRFIWRRWFSLAS